MVVVVSPPGFDLRLASSKDMNCAGLWRLFHVRKELATKKILSGQNKYGSLEGNTSNTKMLLRIYNYFRDLSRGKHDAEGTVFW